MKIGFTGTQDGMTQEQKDNLRLFLISISARELHHGDCIGADAEAHAIAMEMNIPVVIHPPSDPKKRAFCEGAAFVHPSKPYKIRNHHIVDETEMQTATPNGKTEHLRSGTWMTVRYARKKHRIIWIFFPDGSISSNAPFLEENKS